MVDRAWTIDPSCPLDPAAAEQLARHASAALESAVRDEVDDARIGATRALALPDGTRMYAGAVVVGPLRVYTATVWGPSTSPSRHEIVSHGSDADAQAALESILARQGAQGYVAVGTIDGEA